MPSMLFKFVPMILKNGIIYQYFSSIVTLTQSLFSVCCRPLKGPFPSGQLVLEQ